MQNIVILVFVFSATVLAEDGKAPRFSIGLGVLAPSYSQKFAGNGRLDVDQDKNGFSYSLNNPHPVSTGSSGSSFQSQSNSQNYHSAPTSGSDYSSPPGQFSIYQHRSIPKQSSDALYRSPSEDEYNGPKQNSPLSISQGSPNQYQQSYNSPSTSGQSYSAPQQYNNEPDYNSEGNNVANGQQSGPRFAPFNFEQQIAHQVQDHSPFQTQSQYSSPGSQSYQSQPSLTQSYQSQPSLSQSYQSQPSLSQSYQSQPSQQRLIRLQTQPIQSQQQSQYKAKQPVYLQRI